MHWGTIVGIDHVTGRTSARSKVSCVIVRAHKIQRGVQKASFLQADENRICASSGSKPTVAQASPRPAGFLQPLRDANVSQKSASSFEDPQHISGLCHFKPWQWIQVRQDSLSRRFLGRRCGHRLQPLWHSIHAVAFAVLRPLVRSCSIVIEGGPPQHTAMRHHALFDFKCLLRMTTSGTATDMRDAQITGIDELDEFRALMIQSGVGSNGIGRAQKNICQLRQNMRPFFIDSRRISTVAIRATEFHGGAVVGIMGVAVTVDAAKALCASLLVSLLRIVNPDQMLRQRIGC